MTPFERETIEYFIPWDLRERLAEQIKVVDRLMARNVEQAVAAERERCALVCDNLAQKWVKMTDIGNKQAAGAHLCAAAIRKGE